MQSYNGLYNLQKDVWIDWKYKVDFYLPEKRLIIEIKDSTDDTAPDKAAYFAERGFAWATVSSHDISSDPDGCVARLARVAADLPDSTSDDESAQHLAPLRPDEYRREAGCCPQMQRVIEQIFSIHDLPFEDGVLLVLEMDPYLPLSVGTLYDNQFYVAYENELNGERAVDPEYILYRYFDTTTNQMEMIPLSHEHYLTGYTRYARLDHDNRVIVDDRAALIGAARDVDRMARQIEAAGFLAADFEDGETEDETD